jgi:hypothetical protein
MSSGSNPMPPQREVVDHTFYYNELCQRIDAAQTGGRIALLAMSFDPRERATAAIMDTVYAAVERGVETHFATDAWSFMVDGDLPKLGPLFFNSHLPDNLPPAYHNKRESLRQIGAFATGHASIINTPKRAFSLPIAGRSHIKGAVIDNWSAIGGV